jgi:hypothetical protein
MGEAMARRDRAGEAGQVAGDVPAGPASLAGWAGVLTLAATSLRTGLRLVHGRRARRMAVAAMRARRSSGSAVRKAQKAVVHTGHGRTTDRRTTLRTGAIGAMGRRMGDWSVPRPPTPSRGVAMAARAGFRTGRRLGGAAPEARVAAARHTAVLGSSWRRTMRRVSLVLGFAGGYLLGAKAGEERYQQLVEKASDLAGRLTGTSSAGPGETGAAPQRPGEAFVPPAPRLEPDATSMERATNALASDPVTAARQPEQP